MERALEEKARNEFRSQESCFYCGLFFFEYIIWVEINVISEFRVRQALRLKKLRYDKAKQS